MVPRSTRCSEDRLRPAALPPIRATPESLPPVPADEWEGDETPRPVQGLSRAMGSGGGMVRSQSTIVKGSFVEKLWVIVNSRSFRRSEGKISPIQGKGCYVKRKSCQFFSSERNVPIDQGNGVINPWGPTN